MAETLTQCQAEVERLGRERALYARLLDLGGIDDPETLLRHALEVAAQETSAVKGYLAVFPPEHQPGDPPQWSTAIGCSTTDQEQFQREFSGTIIDHTLVTRRVTLVPSAVGSPHYRDLQSVRANRITSVVCAPIGGEASGILYLQGKMPGIFDERDERFVVQLGQHLGRWIDRLIYRDGTAAASDPTRVHRRGGAFHRLVGRSRALASVLEAARRLARLPVTVLITGAPGTGKSTLAEELHLVSTRADGPLVIVDAAAHDPGDLAADLVGRADAGIAGLFAEADEGTLVIENVEAMSFDAQRALVGLVETGRWRPLRGDRDVEGDVRVVAVTSTDLGAACAAGTFLRELHQLLDAHVIRVPGLKERPEDVPLLVDALGRAAAAEAGVPWPGADASAASFVASTAWPRHLTDLRAALVTALTTCERRRPLRGDDLAVPEPVRPAATTTTASWFDLPSGSRLLPWKDAEFLFKRGYLRQALDRHGGNIKQTGDAVGLSRSRMFALMNELGLRDGGRTPPGE